MPDSTNYNTGAPQSLGTIEWSGYRFSELNEGDLFYFEENANTDQNPAFRKVSDNVALDLKNSRNLEVNSQLRVFQKEY